jgi:hypothetical protein
LGFDVPLATALCKNLPAENTQRLLSRPKPTRVAVPIEEEEEEDLYETNKEIKGKTSSVLNESANFFMFTFHCSSRGTKFTAKIESKMEGHN